MTLVPLTVAVGMRLIVWASADEVLVLTLVLPLYTAVMECAPAVRVEVLSVATPELRVMVASDVAPSLKVTEPDGVPAPGATAVTVAVNPTDWPAQVGLTEDTKATEVFALLTVCVIAGEVLPLKVMSPP